MTTLRTAAQQALEALEQIAVLAEYGTTGPGKCHSRALNAQQATALRLSVSDLSRAQITALRAALAEPVQEPVAWMIYTLDGKSVCVTDNPADFTEQHKALPLYTAPPQRKPLTEDEIEQLLSKYERNYDMVNFARAIEQSHGIGSERPATLSKPCGSLGEDI